VDVEFHFTTKGIPLVMFLPPMYLFRLLSLREIGNYVLLHTFCSRLLSLGSTMLQKKGERKWPSEKL
jgi:hypothetical protein